MNVEQRLLIVDPSTSTSAALELASINACVCTFFGVPYPWTEQAAVEGWTIPAVLVQSLEDGAIVSWHPATLPA